MSSHMRYVLYFQPNGFQRLMAIVNPSPTMSMLRSILWSLCSFLLSASRTWEVMSSGAGFMTLPPHSTFKCSINGGGLFCILHTRHTLQQTFLSKAYIVKRNDAPFSYQLKGLLIVSVIVPFISIDKHKVICSSFPVRYECI